MSNDGNLERAASEVLSVAAELTRLRGAVESHGRAADALAEASAGLKRLAETIGSLPDGFSQHFDRGALVVGAIEAALAPAGELRAGVLQVGERLSATAQSLDVGIGKLEDGMSRHATGVTDALSSTFASSVGRIQESMTEWEGRLAARFQAVDVKLKTLEEDAGALTSKLTEITERLDDQESLMGEHHAAATAQLTTLEKLARRSLIAILMGKDPTKT